jgi:hypothetical protein
VCPATCNGKPGENMTNYTYHIQNDGISPALCNAVTGNRCISNVHHAERSVNIRASAVPSPLRASTSHLPIPHKSRRGTISDTYTDIMLNRAERARRAAERDALMFVGALAAIGAMIGAGLSLLF